MRSLGRFLQLLGLVLAPTGLLFGLQGGPRAMSLEIGLLAAGAGTFYVGWRIQQKGG